MRHSISAHMPKEVQLMGATFPVWWFCLVARKYMNTDSVMCESMRACDLTDLVLEAITIGLEREAARKKKGSPDLSGMPVPYLRRTAANLVHQAARKSLGWQKRMTYSDDDFERSCGDGPEKYQSAHASHNGLYGLFPIEELLFRQEEALNTPMARLHRKK